MAEPKTTRMAECHPTRKHHVGGKCEKCYAAEYRAANREVACERTAQWRAKNPEKAKGANDAWRSANFDKAAAGQKQWRSRNPDRVLTKNLKQYGLDAASFHKMSESQSGLCLICHEVCPSRKRLSVDHCHTTKKVRGLLCLQCNMAVGHMRDNPQLARAMATYLEVCS